MSSNWTPKKRAALLKRIRPWVYRTHPDNEPAVAIRVEQLDTEGRAARKVTRFGYPDPWPVDIETLTSAIIEFLQEDADAQKAFCKYQLTPLYGTGLVDGDDTMPLGIDGGKPDEGDYELSSGPTENAASPAGRLAAEYRHLENMHRMYFQGHKENMDSLRSENTSLRARSEGDDARRLNFYNRMDQASLAQWKIRKEEMDAQFMQENLRDLKEVAKPIAYRIVNGIGAKLGVDKANPLLPEASKEEMLLRQFFDGLDLETEWKTILAAVSMKRRIMLSAMADRYKELQAGTLKGESGIDPELFLEQFFGDMQCVCGEPGAGACEWHSLLGASASKRQVLFNMLAEEWFTIRDQRAGTYAGDRPIVEETKH